MRNRLTFYQKSDIIRVIQYKGGFPMTITATEFKANFGKYIEMVAEEEFFITKNGKIIAKVINPNVSAVDSLRGILQSVPDIDLNTEREERLEKYENYD